MRKVKPTFEEIKELEPRCAKKCEALFDKWKEDEEFYELNFDSSLDLPKEFADEGIILPTARDMVDTFVDHIDLSNPRVYVNKKSISRMSAEEAEMMRKFYLGLNYAINLEADIAPVRVAGKHYALHGLAVIKTIWDADRWPDKPRQSGNESEDEYAERLDEWRYQTHQTIPIVIQAINPRCIIPDPSYGGRMFVFEKHKKLCLDISKRWPNWNNPQNRKLGDEVEFISYWDDTYRCDMADGEPIIKVGDGVVKHNYGFIPYVFIDSGLGNISYEAKLEMRYVGILRYMLDLLIAESRDFSISDIVLKKEAWPWFTLEGERAGEVTEIKQIYGSPTALPPGVTVRLQTPQLPPEALNAHLYRTSDYIAAHAAPRSIRGLSESGVRSGADRRLIISEAASRYQYSTDAFKHGWAKVLINCAKLYKNVIPGDIRVWARTPTDEFDVVIDKDKMKEPFTCYVEFAPISEEDEYRRHDDLERLISTGVVTKRWARTQMPNVDPIAMEREEEKELLRKSPAYIQMKTQYLAGKLAEAISKRQAAEGMAEGKEPMAPGIPEVPGAPGRRLVPPIPERAPLGSPEEIQRQLEQLRSQTPMYPGQGMGGGGQR